MPVNRTLLDEPLSKSRVPNWLCPRCNGGHLRLMPNTWQEEHSGDSREVYTQEEAFDPEWLTLRFVAIVKCDNNDCQETAVVAGNGKVIEIVNWKNNYWESDYEHRYFPTYINPSPPIIPLPEKCPKSVTNELKMAEVSLWGDAASAANHLRSAVERLLDEQKCPKKKGLSLHDRLKLFEKDHSRQAQALLAVKCLGNIGSHADENEVIERKDVFDMFDILESVLKDLYGPDKEELEKLISTINEKKGPV